MFIFSKFLFIFSLVPILSACNIFENQQLAYGARLYWVDELLTTSSVGPAIPLIYIENTKRLCSSNDRRMCIRIVRNQYGVVSCYLDSFNGSEFTEHDGKWSVLVPGDSDDLINPKNPGRFYRLLEAGNGHIYGFLLYGDEKCGKYFEDCRRIFGNYFSAPVI